MEDFAVENCHWGQTVPTMDWCPWTFYRVSGDITNTWDSVWKNLHFSLQFVTDEQTFDKSLSRPGCWSYPDMLEVGRM